MSEQVAFGRWLWPGIILVGGIALVGLGWFINRPEPASAPEPAMVQSTAATQKTSAPTTPSEGTVDRQTQTPGMPDDEPENTELARADERPSDPAPQDAEQNTTEPPRLDELRIEEDGLAVMAGRAQPGASLVLRLNGEEITTVTSDAAGKFAAVAYLDDASRAGVLSLAELGPDGTERLSPDEMLLTPVLPMPDDIATTDATSREETAPEPKVAEQTSTETAPAAPNTAQPDTAAAQDLDADTTTLAIAGLDASAQAARDETAARVEQIARAEPAAPEPAAKTPTSAPAQRAPNPDRNILEPSGSVTEAAPAIDAQSNTAPTAIGPQGNDAAQASLPAPSAQDSAASLLGNIPTVPAAPAHARVAILKSSDAGVEVIQPAAPALNRIALDAIGYSSQGDVELSGRAQTHARRVRVYLDNDPVAALRVDESGTWRGALPDVDIGVYTLRLDELDETGTVTSRVETPFKREDPAVLALATGALGPEPLKAVTVQNGATLWAIARERYGEGTAYVRVFEANRDLIRDPDLIYPGQVFTLPED